MTNKTTIIPIKRFPSKSYRHKAIEQHLQSEYISFTIDEEKKQIQIQPKTQSINYQQITNILEEYGFEIELKDHLFTVIGISCASCVNKTEKSLKGISGVVNVTVNFANETVAIQTKGFFPSEDQLIEEITKLGYSVNLGNKAQINRQKNLLFKKDLLFFWTSLILTAPLLLQMLFSFELYGWLQLVLASIVQFVCGSIFYKKSFYALKKRQVNMDVLIALGTSAAYFYSLFVWLFSLPLFLYFESSTAIITLVLLGRLIEMKTKGKTHSAIESLINLSPKKAWIEIKGKLVPIDLSDIKRGDLIVVKPSENIPIDGEVIGGRSYVDESMLTGESALIPKKETSKVYQGTLNQEGVLKVKAISVGKDTALSAIIKLVEEAQRSKAPIQKLADKVSSIFVPIVIGISFLTLILWWSISLDFSSAFINAIAVLVIACPCALGLATPTVIMVSSGIGAKAGILFKNAKAIEIGGKIDTLVIDKTGTLTKGKLEVTDVHPITGNHDEFMSIIASIEQYSEHPIGQAILKYSDKNHIPYKKVSNFKAIFGKGARGKVDANSYFLCSIQSFTELKLPNKTPQEDQERISALESEGKTLIIVVENDQYIGFIALSDTLRDTSHKAILELKKLSIDLLMLTGDHAKTAEAIARQVGIERYRAEVMPNKKSQEIIEIQKEKKICGMVGDGVNDAPALAQADVGFAIGSGSDISISSSDVTLMKSDLLSVADAILLSRTTMKKIKQNLFFAFIYNCIGIPLAAFGLLNPIIASGAMALSSISVIINALTLKKWSSIR